MLVLTFNKFALHHKAKISGFKTKQKSYAFTGERLDCFSHKACVLPVCTGRFEVKDALKTHPVRLATQSFIFISAFLQTELLFLQANASHSSDAFQLAGAHAGMCLCLKWRPSTLCYANYGQTFAISQGGVAHFTLKFPHPVRSERGDRRGSQ